MNPPPPTDNDPATSTSADWPLELLLEMKGASRISVVIPARNEEATVGQVIESIAALRGTLVDELVVMDSLSRDRTAEVASAAGAQVHSVGEVRAELGVRAGKGEALWKSMFVTDSDIVAFIDADLTEWGIHFVLGVLGPLMADPRLKLCRGFYDRVFDTGSDVTTEGGRVTELVARPWLALHRPELAGCVQPLAGEWAIRREVFEQLSIPIGYGVELATLLDVHEKFGLGAIAQVDLGRRAHRHQHQHDLAAMAVELLDVAERRRVGDVEAYQTVDGQILSETRLRRMDSDREWTERFVSTDERPPIVTTRLN
jgi:glucosyl-3-phosphoglycerate synthase